MKKVIIWDLPIRIFHWLFAGCCLGALSIGLLVDDESSLFRVHMLLGLAACFLVVLRLAIGVVGSRHNRLASIVFSPAETIRYFVGVFTGKAGRYLAHNPGAAMVTIGMLILVPLIVCTGLDANEGDMEDLHGALAYGLLALVFFHLAGLAIHTVRHKEQIALSMITGMKQGDRANGLRSHQRAFGLAILLVSVLWIGALFSDYDSRSGAVRIPGLGSIVQLGERDGDEKESPYTKDDD